MQLCPLTNILLLVSLGCRVLDARVRPCLYATPCAIPGAAPCVDPLFPQPLYCQVLDARDPLACRCVDVERYIRQSNPNKRIILLLNKMGESEVWSISAHSSLMSGAGYVLGSCCSMRWVGRGVGDHLVTRPMVGGNHSMGMAHPPAAQQDGRTGDVGDHRVQQADVGGLLTFWEERALDMGREGLCLV